VYRGALVKGTKRANTDERTYIKRMSYLVISPALWRWNDTNLN